MAILLNLVKSILNGALTLHVPSLCTLFMVSHRQRWGNYTSTIMQLHEYDYAMITVFTKMLMTITILTVKTMITIMVTHIRLRLQYYITKSLKS